MLELSLQLIDCMQTQKSVLTHEEHWIALACITQNDQRNISTLRFFSQGLDLRITQLIFCFQCLLHQCRQRVADCWQIAVHSKRRCLAQFRSLQELYSKLASENPRECAFATT